MMLPKGVIAANGNIRSSDVRENHRFSSLRNQKGFKVFDTDWFEVNLNVHDAPMV